ncbi:MAG: MopE-related protein, partial [Saprospiraceae bacterium]
MKKPNRCFNKILIAFAVAIFFSLNSFSQNSTVIRGPYLQSGTSTSTIVKWRTSNSTNSQVWYGTDVNNLSQTEIVNGSQTDHEVTVSGLIANTIYYYAIGDSFGQMVGGNGDASHYFKTAPTIGASQPVRAWILGDCGTADFEQEQVRDAYYNYIGSNHTDMVLMLGDNAYDDGFDSEYQDAMFDVYPDKLKNSIFWSCPGNHDYFGSGLNNAYYDIFSFPSGGEAGGLASNTEKYYSFDYANIHIISLDSHDENRSPGSPMLTWLENDLAATTQDWIVVMFHHPPYSKGSHDSDDTSENRMIEMRENVLPICESYGVDLVLSGHSHAYERSNLINGHYGFSSTFDSTLHMIDGGNGQVNGTGAYQQNTNIEGTVYVVTGSAGGSSPVGNHPVMYASLESLGSTILEVNGHQMDVKFLNENGVVGDYLTLVQNGQPVIHWTNPNNGDFFTNLDPVALNVDAFDSNGDITQVEYFVDGVSIGIDAVAPYSLNWTPIVFGNYLVKATATDNEGNNSSKEISISFDNTNPTSIAIQINDEDDDAEESEGDMAVNSNDLDLVEDGQNEQTVGLVFNDLNIPQGAIITNAYIQFTADDTDSGTTNLMIYGEATDNALSFTSSDFNITSRPTTAASVNWIPPAWNAQGEAGANQQTPDLSTLVQEIVDRAGWLENNSMGFIISGIGIRNAYSYDGSSSNAAVLHIDFAINPCAPFLDVDRDGFCSDVDCDDTNPMISPGATEICDGIDNNCDGQIDEGLSNIYFADTDADGFGDPNNSIQDCSLPVGYVSNNTDCDDTDESINPGVAEVCDGIDNNCDGQIDEEVINIYFADTDADGFGDPNNLVQACSLPVGYVSDNTDCDDTDGNVNPSVIEICDGIDNNCDGQIDEGLLNTYFVDIDADGFGDPNNSIQACSLPSDYVSDNTDCDDTNESVNPNATEICDGIDNNCDGQIDEGVLNTYFADTDTDGFGDPNNSIQACSLPSGYVSNNTDCDDKNGSVNPNATEICDGIDNNCDGEIDEGLINTYYADTDTDGFGDPNNSIQGCSPLSGYVSNNTDCDDTDINVNPSVTEVCDGIDNNCDGQIDEGLINTYFVDLDNDGFGDPNNSVQACSLPSGYVSNNTDCDDTASNIYIGASCDDSNPNTINDSYNSNCICIGDFAPTVIWTSPTGGQFFTNLNPITLNVDAVDSDGNITQVEYFVNGVSIGTDVIAPYSFSWVPPTYGSFLLKATATDNGGNITSSEISISLQDISPTSLVIQISDGDDDAEESTGDMILSSSDLEMVEDGSDEQTVGLVFNGLNIPSGAVIANAYIQFTTDETDSGSTNLTIHGEDTDNALSFTSSDFNLTSRPITSASVNWIPPSWSSEGEAGVNQQTPDLSILVQEIVDRTGWIENNSMGFIISGVGNRTAESYNGSSSDAAILHITFGVNPCEPFFDLDKDGFCSDIDCDDTNPAINSGAIEICDGIDNNCNGQIDEGVMITYFADGDNDGFGDSNNSLQACSLPSGYVLNNTDCDDTDGSVNPSVTEICDGID